MSGQYNISYLDYLKRVDLKKLIEFNTFINEEKKREFPVDTHCLYCDIELVAGEALRLNDGKYICENCLDKIQSIRYPDKYQQLYEAYLLKSEARRIAHDELMRHSDTLIDNHLSTQNIRALNKYLQQISSIIGILMFSILIVLIYFSNKFTPILALLLIVGVLSLIRYFVQLKLNQNKRYNNELKEQERVQLDAWCNRNPQPDKPILLEFCDPNAQLSAKDKKILRIFDYWPGYPPYWNYLRLSVLNSDDNRCQISGCPSRTGLHIHHIHPISQGGSHKPDNLVTLCEFHHGLQPETGHERVWGKVKTQYFSMVKAHFREGSFVKAHVRRRALVTINEIQEIVKYYKISCNDCNHYPLSINVNETRNSIFIKCTSCGSEWVFEQKLSEESGPQIAATLKVSMHPGRGNVDLSLMQTIRKPKYMKKSTSISSSKKSIKSTADKSNIQGKVSSSANKSYFCPHCGKQLRIRDGRFGKFYGCYGYPACTFTVNLKDVHKFTSKLK